jgi:hypothetical protein
LTQSKGERSSLLILNVEKKESDALKINIRISKTDQFDEGFIKALPYFDSSQYCSRGIIKKLDRDIKNNIRSCI